MQTQHVMLIQQLALTQDVMLARYVTLASYVTLVQHQQMLQPLQLEQAVEIWASLQHVGVWCCCQSMRWIFWPGQQLELRHAKCLHQPRLLESNCLAT